MNKDQLLQKRNELLENVAQFTANKLELEAALDRLNTRIKSNLEDLIGYTQELNKVLEEEAKKNEPNEGE